MKNILTICSKEYKSYLTSPIAYIIIAAFVLGSGFFFVIPKGTSAAFAETSMRGVFGNTYYLIIVFLLMAVLTMRLIAEEKKLGTIELLMTAPVRDSELVIGKFLGSLTLLITMLVFTIYYPIMLILFGDPDIGPILSGYLGFFLLGAMGLSIGIFTSSLTSNQIIAAVVAGAILMGLWFLNSIATLMPNKIANTIGYFSPASYIPDFYTGIVDTRGIIYFVSVICLFLFLAIRSLENSRWN
jgi:ABC-2 type transport system permease protein